MRIQDQPDPYIVPHCEKQIEIIYQDDDLLLINKPDGLLSVPGRHPLNKDSVINRLREEFPDAEMAHRLDLDTSGIMVIPLHKECLRRANRLFQERKVDKTYTAVVYGVVAADGGKIELPLIKDWPNRPLQKVCHESGKWALTYYELLEQNEADNTSRLRLTPITGRSHQLRIHLSKIGHPILGCDMYAHQEGYDMADRLLLHATTLSFVHPMTGKDIQGECLPEF